MSCPFDYKPFAEELRQIEPQTLMEKEIPIKDLKRCPFCGKEVNMYISQWADEYTASVTCKNCGAGLPCHHDKNINKAKLRMTVAWNRRSYA